MPGRSRPMTRTEWRVFVTLKPTCAAAAISPSPWRGVMNNTPLPDSARRAMMNCRSAPASRSVASACARPPGLSSMVAAHTSTRFTRTSIIALHPFNCAIREICLTTRPTASRRRPISTISSATWPGSSTKMHTNVLRITLRAPLPTGVLEIPDKLLLLRVHRDHQLSLRQRLRHARVDMGELRVAVRMALALAGLAVALQAELLPLEHFSHDRMADLVSPRPQLCRQPAQALAGPAQRRHRVAALRWRNQRHQVVQQRRV